MVFSCSSRRRRSVAWHHDPALQFRDRRVLLDLHPLSYPPCVGLVVGVVFLGAAHRLLHDRVGKPALHTHHDGLRLLVAHHFALQYALRHLSAPQTFSSSFGGRGALSLRNGLDAGDVAADLANARRVRKLPGRSLEAQVELLLLELDEFVVQLVRRHRPEVIGFKHRSWSTYSAMRSTKRVLIGSLAAARSSASRASAVETPSISNRMRPGLIRTTHNSGAPLPEPMRTSSGFFETGTSG